MTAPDESHIKTLEYLEILLQDWLFQHCHSQPWHIWDKHLDSILKENISQSHKQHDFTDTFHNILCKKQFHTPVSILQGEFPSEKQTKKTTPH